MSRINTRCRGALSYVRKPPCSWPTSHCWGRHDLIRDPYFRELDFPIVRSVLGWPANDTNLPKCNLRHVCRYLPCTLWSGSMTFPKVPEPVYTGLFRGNICPNVLQ